MNKKDFIINLFKNTGIIGLGRVITKVFTFALIPLYTRILTTSEYGLVDLLITYGTLMIPIVNLQLENAIFRFSIDNRNDVNKLKEVFSAGFFLFVFLSSLFGVLLLVTNRYYAIQHLGFIAAYTIITIWFYNCSSACRGLGYNVTYSIGNFIFSFVTVVTGFFLVVIKGSRVNGLLIANILGPLLGGIYIGGFSRLYKFINFKYISVSRMREMVQYSIPLIPNELSWWILKASDRSMVRFFCGVSATGIVAIANKFSYVYTICFQIFYISWLEQSLLILKKDNGYALIKNFIQDIIIMLWTIALLYIEFLSYTYKVIIDKEFYQAYSLVGYYILAAFFNAIIGIISPIYLGNNETKTVAKSTFFAAIINILVNAIFIKKFGIVIASISSSAAYGIIAIIRIIDIKKRYFDIRIEKNILSTYLFLTFGVFINRVRSNAVIDFIIIITLIFVGSIQVRKFWKNWIMN